MTSRERRSVWPRSQSQVEVGATTAAHRLAGRMDVGDEDQRLEVDPVLVVVDHQKRIFPVRARRELRVAIHCAVSSAKCGRRMADAGSPTDAWAFSAIQGPAAKTWRWAFSVRAQALSWARA